MKVLVFGRGVIGSIYGWVLQDAGHTVHFYVRPGRAAVCGDAFELRLLDARARLTGTEVAARCPTVLREDLPANHDYDLILVSVQHHRFEEAVRFLATRVADATVLVFNNLWTEPEDAVRALPRAQLAWGFPSAGGGFDADGVLRAALFRPVLFGSFNPALTAREAAVRALFKQSGLRVVEQPDFKGWLWIHFATNAGLQAEFLRAEGRLLTRSALTHAVATVRQMLGVVAARGVDLSRHRGSTLLFRLPPSVGSASLALAQRLLKPLRVVLEAHANPDELRFTCRDALAEARRLGVSVPRLEAAEPLFVSA
ncbi:MAG: ketopantoate reductase [Alphaproteobacteria bacterium]|nr:ketopantoate reductase [Alphaproteobacteria bacterium]